MRQRAAFLAALSFAFAVPAAAQIPRDSVGALLDRLRVDPATTTEADCRAKIGRAAELNAMGLFHGASVCGAVRMEVESSFLLAAGQIRAMADMGTMEAASESDQIGPGSLYYLIFFHLGGPGSEDVLRDPAETARLFHLLDDWTAVAGPDYDPGWPVGRRPEATAYQAAFAASKLHRRRQLAAMVRAFSDPDYYSLHREFTALQQRVRVFEQDTPEATRADDLQRQMGERGRVLGLDFDGDGEPDPVRPPPSPGEDAGGGEASEPVAEDAVVPGSAR